VSLKPEEATNILADLSKYLEKDIEAEKKEAKPLPKITGFEVKTDGPNVTLTRDFQGETITVKFSVNGSLTNGFDDQEPEKGASEADTGLKSHPVFTVDIKKKDQILSFTCDFMTDEVADEKNADEDFNINELAIHSGDWNENVYTVDASVLDENLYDLLLNLLDERGIGPAFATELSKFSFEYEHNQYISLLEKMKNFTA